MERADVAGVDSPKRPLGLDCFQAAQSCTATDVPKIFKRTRARHIQEKGAVLADERVKHVPGELAPDCGHRDALGMPGTSHTTQFGRVV